MAYLFVLVWSFVLSNVCCLLNVILYFGWTTVCGFRLSLAGSFITRQVRLFGCLLGLIFNLVCRFCLLYLGFMLRWFVFGVLLLLIWLVVCVIWF